MIYLVVKVKKMKEKQEHCTHYEYNAYFSRIVCISCELGYYIMDFNCYKIPSKIENCKIYEEFYTNEVSCLYLEEGEGEEEDVEYSEYPDSDENNISKSLLINFLYLIIFNLLILI